jgi:DNA-binding LacI/PurR family transcriptional regulator
VAPRLSPPRTVHAPLDPAAIGTALEPVLPSAPTALYAFNDEFALAAIAALGGREMAVIGTDDSAVARRTKLTTVALGHPSHWTAIVSRLHETIERENDDRSPIIERPRVVPGATT